MDDTARVYRQLKSVRAQMKRRLKELLVESKLGNIAEIEDLQESARNLAYRKTVLRKEFEILTERKGPYKVS